MISNWFKTAGDKVSKMASDLPMPDLPSVNLLKDRSGHRELKRDDETNATGSDRQPNGLTNEATSPDSPSDGRGYTRAESCDSMASGSSRSGFGFLKEAATNARQKLFSKLSLDHEPGENEKLTSTYSEGICRGASSPKISRHSSYEASPKETRQESEEEKKEKIEKSKYASMWRNIVNNSMVGTGIVSKAAIVSQDGLVLAQSSEMNVTKEQIVLLSKAIQKNPGTLAVNGITLGEDTFMYTRSEIGNAVYGVDESGDGGCVICVTKRCLMMGVYEKHAAEANNLVEELADYLRGRDM